MGLIGAINANIAASDRVTAAIDRLTAAVSKESDDDEKLIAAVADLKKSIDLLTVTMGTDPELTAKIQAVNAQVNSDKEKLAAAVEAAK